MTAFCLRHAGSNPMGAALVGNRCERARIQPSFATLRTGLGQLHAWPRSREVSASGSHCRRAKNHDLRKTPQPVSTHRSHTCLPEGATKHRGIRWRPKNDRLAVTAAPGRPKGLAAICAPKVSRRQPSLSLASQAKDFQAYLAEAKRTAKHDGQDQDNEGRKG